MRRLVMIILSVVTWALSLAAEVDPHLLHNLDKPILDLIMLNAEDTEEIRSALGQRWKNAKRPTLRELVQTPRSVLYSLNEKDQMDIPSQGPIHRLQRWLAIRGFSLGMSDQDISELSRRPESVRYRSLEETGFTRRIYRPFYHLGIYTIYDLFERFPNINYLDVFLKQRMKEKGIPRPLKVGPQGADLIKEFYLKAMSEWQLEKEKGTVQDMDPRFAALLSNELIEVLLGAGILNQEELYKRSDSQLKDLQGMNLRLISELYEVMVKLEIYDSPERCNGIFQG